ncbi:DUF6796 family protein [Paratractidigestivibacter sp.]|uniref:DUF6796 family protein n=1 Tax=Paratractidigestivibacter sp. TaxID=2847316 RepID=UPI002AC8E165|nr:DUF6796 family protein [Paratractidigestivibacter sp.]
MDDFNGIGISRHLDWPRVSHLLRIGLFGALLALAGNLILGWGVEDGLLAGLARMLPTYTGASDGGLLAAALLGLFGTAIQALSYFGTYQLMAERVPQLLHRYRAGIFGFMIFGACGFRVPACALVFLAKHGIAEELLQQCATYFMLPAFVLFWVFFLLLTVTQIQAFAKGMTPYPRRCWVFCPLVGMAATVLANVFGNQPWANAISCAWVSVGNIWMFAGLLATMGPAGPPARLG